MSSRRTLFAIPVVVLASTTLGFACGGASLGGLLPVGDAGDAGDVDATTAGGGCVSGKQISCACAGGGPTGVQTCNADGRGYGACRGCAVDDGSSTGGSDASPTSGDAGPEGGDGGNACSAGRSDCNGGTASNTDGCECATPGCCGTACQSAHSNGLGQPFYDCVAQGTHTQAQARAACAAFTRDAGACTMSSACCDDSLGLCITVQSTDALCGAASGQCHCWSYVGHDSGTVQTPDAGCAEICPAAGDPSWN